MWGYIYQQNIAPVWVGEFGTKLSDPKDAPWLQALTAYLGGDFDNDGKSDLAPGEKGISWTYWSWNPNSGDTGGILADDWQTVNQAKLAYLSADRIAVRERRRRQPRVFAVTLSQPATQPITVDFHTVAGSATIRRFHAGERHAHLRPGRADQDDLGADHRRTRSPSPTSSSRSC